jgi:putative membrane protein
VAIAVLYHFEIIKVNVPWLPLSVIGTAVAFYVGFKNNQSYDRLWEARKIWGGIVNDSRTWGMMVDSYVSNLFTETDKTDEEIHAIKQRLMYRHMAWLYQHRRQLLVHTPWEQVAQDTKRGASLRRTIQKRGAGLFDRQNGKVDMEHFISPEEFERISKNKNSATQLINEQSRDLRELRKEGVIDDFRHMEMENVLKSFYTLQGKNERIKKFPLPRQYANMSRIFVFIFMALLPVSMLPTLMEEAGDYGLIIAVPLTILIAWVYFMMEIVGDFSENPFQGVLWDIPMLSLCRTIEIDLREMLGETELPEAVKAHDNTLM